MQIQLRFLSLLLLLISTFNVLASEILKSQMVPMRDGVHLSTDIHYEGELEKERPTILVRTVYNKNSAFDWNSTWKQLVNEGYAIVIQDIRGRYESEGLYHAAHGRREDGMDTLDWIIQQPWSNGKVGLGGCSYLGETQVILEATNHPALVVGHPQSPASGYYRPGRAWQAFSGGAFELGQTAGWFASNGNKVFYGPQLTGKARSDWFNSQAAQLYRMTPATDFDGYLSLLDSLPVISLLQRSGIPPSDFEAWRGSHPDGEYFRGMDFVKAEDRVSVPNLFFDTWYDYGARETLMMAEQFRRTGLTEAARQHQYVVVGPGTHCNYPEKEEDLSAGERPLSNTAQAYTQMQTDWYNHWLADGPASAVDRPFLTYYVLGADEWRTAEAWPLPNTQRTRWYLSPQNDGTLTLQAPVASGHDEFTYDPGNPVPTNGGHSCCTGSDREAGGYDQREIEKRDDVLLFTSEPLGEGIEVTGLLKAHLFVSSSAPDTDFTVKLIDVYPTGEAYNVQEGIVRMRYRDSLREPELMTPGEVYEIEVDLNASSNWFGEGHRIRIEVSSSNFPRFERNLNTGKSNASSTEYVTAKNTIWHGGEHASYLDLPVIPRQAPVK